MKDGYCTVLFKAFLQNKMSTMKMKGGNTDTIYNTGDQRREFADSLHRQHPEIVRTVWRYNRWHHEVDYSRFKANKLKRNPNFNYQDKVNNYGMVLKKIN